MPKVSVVIPTYNRPSLLQKAIQSVLNQTFQEFEIIVVDDGEEKRANNIVKSFKNDKIKYIQHKHSMGGAVARNTGIKNAQGKYIAFLDDDDEWLPEKLKLQVEVLDKSGDDVGFCFSAVTQKRDEGVISGEVKSGVMDYYERSLQTFKGILTSSLLIKKNVFTVVGMFDEEFPTHQEAELMIRISKEFKGIGINKPLVVMMVFSNHKSVGKNLQNRIIGRELILKKHFAEFKKRPDFLAKHYFQLALFYRDDKQYKKARSIFKKAWQTKFNWRYFAHYLMSNIKILKLYILTKTFFRQIHFGTWMRAKYFDYYFKKYILDKKDIKNVLDAGCGRGRFSKKVATQIKAANVLGLDIKNSKNWTECSLKNLKFKVFDISLMNFKNNFDLIISVDVLEHIKNNRNLLQRKYSALKDGGILYLAVPNEKYNINFFPKRWFEKFYKWEEHEHIGEQYTLNELKNILKKIGFHIIYFRYTFTFWGRFAWELEFLVRESKYGGRANILLMPFYKFLGLLDLYFPIGKGNNLIIAQK